MILTGLLGRTVQNLESNICSTERALILFKIFISTTSQISITLQSKVRLSVYYKIFTVYLVAGAGLRRPGALFAALDGAKPRTF